MNKFSNIKYPFFGIKHKPWNVVYDLHKIQVQRTYTGHLESVDDKRLNGDYFARLAQMDHRLKFDYTCKNLQELIYSGCKWGMDSEANPHDLSKSLVASVRCAKITKVNENLVWVHKVSYPFEIPTKEKLELNEDIFGTLVKVDNEWYLKEFSYEPIKTVYARI
tara:strand:- start:556 stop:1047 length:492 start_codon:yes stop_codon:yes gene_type:complete